MSNNYQPISSINISNNGKYSNLNSQLDSAGLIAEKFAQNKYNYYVETISSSEPVSDKPQLIFLEDATDNFMLKELINNSYSPVEALIGSNVLVKDISKVYTLTNITKNGDVITSQTWISGGGIDTSQTLELTNTTKSLITSGPVDINSTLTSNGINIISNSNSLSLNNLRLSLNNNLKISYNSINIKYVTEEIGDQIYNYYCDNNNVYFTDIWKCDVYKYSLNDSSTTLIYKVEEDYMPNFLISENNKVYVSYYDSETSKDYLIIITYNPDTQTYSNEIKDNFINNDGVNKIKCKNEKLYYICYNNELYIYDSNNDEQPIISIELSGESIDLYVDDNYLYVLTIIDSTYTVLKYNLKNLESKTIFTSKLDVSISDKYIVECNNTSNTIITVYDITTLEPETQPIKQKQYDTQLDIYKCYYYDNNIILIRILDDEKYIIINDNEEEKINDKIALSSSDHNCNLFKSNTNKYLLLEENYYDGDDYPASVSGHFLIISNPFTNLNINTTNNIFNINSNCHDIEIHGSNTFSFQCSEPYDDKDNYTSFKIDYNEGSEFNGNKFTFNSDLYVGGGKVEPTQNGLRSTKNKKEDIVMISAYDYNNELYSLNLIDLNEYVIYKYDSNYKPIEYIKLSKEDYPSLNEIYIFNSYILLLSNNGIYSIDPSKKISKILEDNNVNKLIVYNNNCYVLFNSYDYYSKFDTDLNKTDYHIFTQENGYNNKDLNVINLTFNNNILIFIHNLYDNNLIFTIYKEQNNSIVERKLFDKVNFTSEYYIVDTYYYDNFIYYLISKNGSETEIIKINVNNLNEYYLYENVINDNLTQYNKNIYYKINNEHFYLISNNYIYYFNVSDNLISLENKLYAEGCKYISSNQDFYITNNSISFINNNFVVSGDILLNGKIKTSSINAAQINIQDIDVNVNRTITHNTLIYGDINSYKVGDPVFIKEGNVYILQRKFNDGKYPIYEYEEINENNYIKNSINQIPMITNEDNGKFIGVITAIYLSGTPLKINEITSNYIKINNDTIDFATHGDYIFKVKNNIVHNTTKKINDNVYESRLYQVGDKILYDGTIIDPDTPITSRLLSNCVGIITYIPENNSEYVSVFKS